MLRVGDELITLTDPDAPASEAYRTLRTNIIMRNLRWSMLSFKKEYWLLI